MPTQATFSVIKKHNTNSSLDEVVAEKKSLEEAVGKFIEVADEEYIDLDVEDYRDCAGELDRGIVDETTTLEIGGDYVLSITSSRNS